MGVVLACDLGGTTLRVALVDAQGAVLADAMVDSPAGSSGEGWAEIDAADWWRAYAEAVEALAQNAGALFDAAEALATCGVTRTQVFLDAAGRALRPAITWRDARAADVMDEVLAAVPPGHAERAALNPFHPLARLAWLRRHEPAAHARLRSVAEPKDYLNLRLTGVLATDEISSARLAAVRGAPLAAVGCADAVLPAVLPPEGEVGRVAAGLPGALGRLAGRPVYACAHDTWAAVVGLGALRPGHAYNISGTTEVFGVIGTQPAQAPGLMTVDWGAGLHQIGGPGQNGADTVAWLLQLLARQAQGKTDVAGTLDALLARPRDPQPLLFLPYLQGERVPYWDAGLRGAFVGLNRRHGAGDLAWAVLEGVAFLNRIVLERGEQAAGSPVSEIHFGGGAAANPVWCQVKADVCERPLVVGAQAQPGIVGAAAVAWTGLGRYASLDAAQQALARPSRRHEPDAARSAAYRRLFELYRRAEDALAPISRELAAHAA
ncbi:MAG TPA: FGGY-family carbohydrate kinase [Bordetella sp.]